MNSMELTAKLKILSASLDGELHTDRMMQTVYATDASVYREIPIGVAIPKHSEDIQQLVQFATKEGISLIPRAGGTSLAGQCVGNGLVVDCSTFMHQILEINQQENWVRVQPGVIRDDLNKFLAPYGLFFGPNTSTANRAMIGGMVGNNSCGSYSIVYGSTRDHVLEAKGILSDGSEVVFKALSQEGFEEKCKQNNLEGKIYQHISQLLSDKNIADEIRAQFPHPDIPRRNTGYALDELLNLQPFKGQGDPFNFCRLLAGSEGTLMFLTEIKIHVDPLPPPVLGLLCVHHTSIDESLRATQIAMQHSPRAVELMDKIILDCTKENKLYAQNRFFVKGDPSAILIIEQGGKTEQEVREKLLAIQQDLVAQEKGYEFPMVFGEDIKKVWNLRKAGLGLLSNVKGSAKPVAVIEDTAVRIEDLPAYIEEFTEMMNRFGQRSVYYAHAGAGELHLRPILDLKVPKDVADFRWIGTDTAKLVKKYKGSLSGEHGDGRVRAEFIEYMVGEKLYALMRELKQVWDPNHIFNPGKITDAPPMDAFLRYDPGAATPSYDTIFDYSDAGGILQAVEQCNGSGDCRKSHLSGGTMCPSYMATRLEKDTTRARANVLREFLTRSNRENPFTHPEIEEVMDLCLGCKGCTGECPSNVDVAMLKAEYLYQKYKSEGIPFSAKAIANVSKLNKLGAIWPGFTNLMLKAPITSPLLRSVMGISPHRSLPKLHKTSLLKWYKRNRKRLQQHNTSKGKVYFFFDEFTNHLDTGIGIKAIELLTRLGYEVDYIAHPESGRAYISKGLLSTARRLAMYNVTAFQRDIGEDTPLVGIEPSAILTFRDEYPRLVIPELREDAKTLGQHALMVEEFIQREIQKGNILPEQFTQAKQHILLHGHCHQKALSSADYSAQVLSIPQNYSVEIIPSGCCGMAGSFGMEKNHFELSMQIGELVLFPAVRDAEDTQIIAAPGTSCRHQIEDGTGKHAKHPVEILWDALA